MSTSKARRRRISALVLAAAVLVLLVPTSTGCGGGEGCLRHGENCSSSYLEQQGKTGVSCCGSEICCTLAGGSGIPTCQRPGSCE